MKNYRTGCIFGVVLVILLGGIAAGGWAFTSIQQTVTASASNTDTAIHLSLPAAESAITPANVEQIVELNRWGKGKVIDVAVDPTGSYVALASTIGIYFYDAETFTELHFIEMEMHSHRISFSPDGQHLAAAISTGEIHLLDVSNRKPVLTLVEEGARISQLVFSADGTLLAAASRDSIAIWNLAEGLLLYEFTDLEQSPVTSLTFSPDGSILAAGAAGDNTIQIWSMESGMMLPVLYNNEEAQSQGFDTPVINSIVFSADGAVLASGHGNGDVQIWQMSDRTLIRTLKHDSTSVNHLQFSTDGEILVVGLQNGLLQIWNVVDGSHLQTLDGQEANIRQIVFASDEQQLISASASGMVKRWQIEDGSAVNQIEDYATDKVLDVIFTADDQSIIASSGDGNVWLQNIHNNNTAALVQHDSHVDTVANSPNGELIATGVGGLLSPGVWDDTIRVWNRADHTLVHTLEGPRGGISGCGIFRNTVVFSPDGALVASAAYDHGVHLWQVSDGTLLHTFDGHALAVLDIIFSPDGSMIASASNDDTVKLWDVAGRRSLLTLPGHLGGATSVAFSPDGQLIATGEATGIVRLWRVSDGELLHTFEDSKNSVSNLVFSPNGAILASGAGSSFDIHLWSTEIGAVLQTLTGHQGRVNSIRFSSDGGMLLSGAEDGTIRLWGVSSISSSQSENGEL